MHPQTSILPTDEQIYERSKNWSSFFSRIVQEENYQEVCYDDIETLFDDENEEEGDSEIEDEQEKTAGNGCRALMKFEVSPSSSDDCDQETLLRKTQDAVEKRKRKWKESGMDRVLDTFDFNAITDKVGSWLRKMNHDGNLPSQVAMHEVHYENHQYELNSDDSLQSADTAKYILSNRKPRVGTCTKMIIKEFRYVKEKRNKLHKKYNCLEENDSHLGEIFNKGGLYSNPRRNRECDASYEYDENRTPTNHNTHYSGRRHTTAGNTQTSVPRNKPCREKSRVKRLNDNNETPTFRTRDKAHSEHCSKSPQTNDAIRKSRSSYRKRRSDANKKRSASRSSSRSSDRSVSLARPRFRKNLKREKKSNVSDTREQKTEVNLKADPKKGPTADVTCFLPDNIVNSTAIKGNNDIAPVKAKSCQLSPVKSIEARIKTLGVSTTSRTLAATKNSIPSREEKELPDKKNIPEQTMRKNSIESVRSASSETSDKMIVLYNPRNETLYNESINHGCFVLTEDYLKKLVGKKQAQRFITFNEKRFPLKFDLSSTVYFMLPADSENSQRSGSSEDDEDVLNMFGKQGSLVEQASML